MVFELEGEVPLDGVEPRVEVLLLLLFPVFAAGLSLEKLVVVARAVRWRRSKSLVLRSVSLCAPRVGRPRAARKA